MIKEFKYFFFIMIIFFFIFFTIRYYFSDTNIKKSYRSISQISEQINNENDNLKFLKSDTEIIVEYVENNKSEKKKKYNFWKLLTNED